MILRLYNKEKEYTFEVIDLNDGSNLFYHFNIPTKEIEDGKYNLELIDNGTVVYEDIIVIGQFKNQTIQYNRGENIYISSPLIAQTEDVTVEITATETVVYPTDGYDAMTSVVIDATPVYENGYNTGNEIGYNTGKQEGEEIGYNSGYTDGSEQGYINGYNNGVAHQKSLLETITISANGTYTKENGYNEIVVDVPDLNGDYNTGYNEGYNNGYNEGLENGIENLPTLDITENGEYNTPNKGVNVNVLPKVNVGEIGLKFGNSKMSEISDIFDFTGLEDGSFLFNNCSNLIKTPDLSVCNFRGKFDKCFQGAKLLENISWFDSSEITSFYSAFDSCTNLKTIPELNTSNVTEFIMCFYSCTNLISLPILNCSKATNMSNFFSYNFNNVGGNNLTDVGGFIGLKCKWSDGGGLNKCPNLTYQSCINILNGLYDFTGNGETPTSSQGILQVHQNFIDLVGDEISIATNKGWQILA